MTREEISQIYYINREIEMWQEELRKLKEGSLRSQKFSNLPRSRKISDPTTANLISQEEIEATIERLLMKVQIKRKEIYEYIESLNDSILRQIIMYRCISLCTWEETAIHIGGSNTADSVRMIFTRHFE